MEVEVQIFQFHYDTNKSVRSKSTLVQYIKFQFHYGTIKSIATVTIVTPGCGISIPLWYD